MYFYELHEGDDEVFEDLLLAHDELFEPDEFFEMVERIRRRVKDGFTHDTLIEAVADGLEAEYGFTTIDDDELAASVHVSTVEDENMLIPTGTFAPEPEWGSDDDVEDDEEEDEEDPAAEADLDNLPDFVTITAAVKTGKGSRPN
jgi:hypothetical protein